MHIVADLTNTKLTSSENAIGLLYIEADSIKFPNEHWTDFVIVVLGWWAEEFLKQMEGQVHGEYHFMDGPLLIESSLDNGTLCFSYKKRRLADTQELYSMQISSHEFSQALKTTINQVLRVCHERHYIHSDVSFLEKQYRNLQDLKI